MADYHGSAEFGLPDSDASNSLDGTKIVFGKAFDVNKGRRTERVIAERIKSHFLTCSKTRGGKGVSLIIPNLVTYKGSVLVIDPKGENAWTTAKFRKEKLGHRVFILDPWGEVKKRYGNKMQDYIPEWDVPASDTFNPLSILDPQDENYSEDLAYIADSLIINQSSKDPFFDDAARELVAGLISYMIETERDDEPTLNGLRILLSNSSEDLAKIAKEAQKLGVKSPAARKLARFTTKSTTNDNVIITAVTQTAFLDSQALNQCLKGNSQIFRHLVECPTTIYLVLPVDKLQTYGRWLRLLVSIGIRTVSCYHGKLKLPVLFMLDEFGTIGKLSAVAQAFGLMAGLNMSVWAFVQDLTQLKDDYGTKWETFIANSQAITFWGVTDQFTAEYFSKMLGTKTVEINSVSVSNSTSKSINVGTTKDGETSGESAQQSSSSSSSVQHIARPLLRPEEIREFPSERGFLIGNHKPYVYTRILYFAEPFFNDLTTPNPNIQHSMPPFLKRYFAAEKMQVLAKLDEIKKTFPPLPPDEKEIERQLRIKFPDFEAAAAHLKKLGMEIKRNFLGRVQVIDQRGLATKFSNKKEVVEYAIRAEMKEESSKQWRMEEARLLDLALQEVKKNDAETYERFIIVLAQ